MEWLNHRLNKDSRNGTFFFFFNKTLALGNWDESSTMIDTPGEKLKSVMEDSCIVKRTGTNATAREFILDEIRDLQCATSSSELFVIATRFPIRLENWFGPQYVDPLLAWHFCRFLDFTNNYNDRWKRKRAWDGRWRDEKIFEISIQFEFSMFGVGFGIDGYWLDICSLWNNGILNAYYRGILFWGGKRFNFFTFDFCIDGIRLMYSFLFLFFSIEGKFKKKFIPTKCYCGILLEENRKISLELIFDILVTTLGMDSNWYLFFPFLYFFIFSRQNINRFYRRSIPPSSNFHPNDDLSNYLKILAKQLSKEL